MEKVRHALANKEEAEKKQASLASVRTEFQARYQQAFTQRQHDVSTDVHAARTRLTENEHCMKTEPSPIVEVSDRADGETSSMSLCRENTDMREAASRDMVDLTVMFGQVALSKENAVPPRSSTGNPFLGSQQEKKPHYVEVLERSDDNVTKRRFKPNQWVYDAHFFSDLFWHLSWYLMCLSFSIKSICFNSLRSTTSFRCGHCGVWTDVHSFKLPVLLP